MVEEAQDLSILILKKVYLFVMEGNLKTEMHPTSMRYEQMVLYANSSGRHSNSTLSLRKEGFVEA